MCNWGCVVGESGVSCRKRAEVEGLLPLLHPGSVITSIDAQTQVSKKSSPDEQRQEEALSLMVHFRGTFDHTLDAKNRLTVPARYRAALSEGVVLAMPVDLKPCVGVWRPEDYERRHPARARRAAPAVLAADRAGTLLLRQLHDADLDAAGRIMVPSFLGEHADLRKEVIVVGVGDRLELWDRTGWNDHRPALLGGVAEITARVDE